MPSNDELMIHIGIISHKYGNNFYASKTEEGLWKQLADYCREWWGEWVSDTEPDNNLTDAEIIKIYFSETDSYESYHTDIIPLVD